ncbi:hypothetical protein NIE88_12695 [Sporolactobacillus shoreicorticis]|uniref:Uncharacterized protein n=1 Tax=Sporolactobacillus shoreicorticis TaxID=1923877 RepID=A0ABW5S7N9_9BACL|nr:hypothetical protein [Sporolactobacillus shoreicorticis]MCO7126623.1 hypothetical protein [Sporolactobacillus shoreicorticis]
MGFDFSTRNLNSQQKHIIAGRKKNEELIKEDHERIEQIKVKEKEKKIYTFEKSKELEQYVIQTASDRGIGVNLTGQLNSEISDHLDFRWINNEKLSTMQRIEHYFSIPFDLSETKVDELLAEEFGKIKNLKK